MNSFSSACGNPDVNYIVYDTISLKIIKTFKWYGKDINRCLYNNPTAKWLNVTHPKDKELLKQINEINKTDY